MKQSLPSRGSKSRKGEGTEPSRNRNDSDAQPLCYWAASCPLAALTFLPFQLTIWQVLPHRKTEDEITWKWSKKSAGPTVLAWVCCYLRGFLWSSGRVWFPPFPFPSPEQAWRGAFCRVWWPRAHFPPFPQRAAASPTPTQPGAAQQSP